MFCLTDTLSSFICEFFSTTPLLQGELVNALPNVTTLAMSSGCTLSKSLRGVIGLVEFVKHKDIR